MNEPDTCRQAVLHALAALERRHGRQVFDLDEIVAEVLGNWSRWESSTTTTHVASHMCRDAPAVQWPDLARAARGRYRLLDGGGEAGLVGESHPPPHPTGSESAESGHDFERRARRVLSDLWLVDLQPATVVVGNGVKKKFDLVSPDQRIVGDAKRYTSLKTPAAKWSTIAEYVWLLQKLDPKTESFLVFGGDADVPERWLARFRPLADPVTFYFLEGDRLTRL